MNCSLSLALPLGLILTVGCSGRPPHQPEDLANPIVTPHTAIQIFAIRSDGKSYVYVAVPSGGAARRLTTATSGWETDPVVSRSGNLVAYALSDGPEAKSQIWVSQIDGSHAHRVSSAEEDAIMPAFGSDDHLLVYVKSRFSGHYSPIARPRRHEFDLMKVLVDKDGPVAGAAPIELTEQHFFDLRSLSVSTDGERVLLSTSGYPIGSLFEEFDLAHPLQIKRIFQPHVPLQPSTGPEFGSAAYIHDGMDIVFAAATEGKSDSFDYNVYQMSDVTGGELIELAPHTGAIDGLTVLGNGQIVITSEGKRFVVDEKTRSLQPLK